MMCNQNKNIIGSIDGSWGFARCDQFVLATTIGGAMAIQKIWVKWTVGSWGHVVTSIVLVLDTVLVIHKCHEGRKLFLTFHLLVSIFLKRMVSSGSRHCSTDERLMLLLCVLVVWLLTVHSPGPGPSRC